MNKFIYVIVVVAALLITGCEQEENIETTTQTDPVVVDFNYLPELTHDEFKAKYQSGEEFFIYIGRPDCGDSRKFEQEFEDLFVQLNDDGSVNFIRYELDEHLYYFDISQIIPGFDKALRKEYQDKYDFYYTPTLLHYKDIDDDPESDAVRMAEWSPKFGFEPTQYMKWFYDTELISPSDSIIHDGGSNRIHEDSE